MAILADADTRVVCQGMTGAQGTFHCERAIAYGTRIVAGVTPGKGGREHLGLPVFDSVADAVGATGATASIIYVPPAHAADAMLEALAAELPLVVCVTERVPVLDMVRVKHALQKRGSKTRLIGPNSIGLITPGACKLGVMPGPIFKAGSVGILSRPSTLTYEAVAQTSAAGLGQSTCLSIGGDPVHGMGFVEALALFLDDPDTKGIVMIGEIGGSEEEQTADYLATARARKPDKPIIAYVAGRHAPPGRRLGHAGAIIGGGRGGVEQKIAALRQAGVSVVESPTLIGEAMKRALDSV